MDNRPCVLHCHSHFSDGSFAPALIALKAMDIGLRAICLTDHDTVAGQAEFHYACARLGLDFLPALEITTHLLGEEIHLIAVGVDLHRAKELDQFLTPNNAVHAYREQQYWQKFHNAGLITDDLATVKGKLGFPAKFAFKYHWDDYRVRFCGIDPATANAETRQGGVAFVPATKQNYVPTLQTIDFIHQLGGLAIYAHPGSTVKGAPELFGKILETLIAAGLDGIEVFHPKNTEPNDFMAIAQHYHLLVSGGSDSHGRFTPKLSLAERSITYDQFLLIKDQLK